MSDTFKLLTAVRETTTSGGTFLGGGPFITLDGAVPGYFQFISQLTPTTQYTHVCIRDETEWEVRKARINSPTQMECVAFIESSTGTEILWPGTGTREVICSLAAIGIQDIVDGDNQTQGAVVRTSDHVYAGKPFSPVSPAVDYAVFTDATTPTLAFTGISGPDSAKSLLHSGTTATAAQRTMDGSIELAATSSIISGYDGSEKHSIVGKSGEELAEFEWIAASDYRFRINEEGTKRRAVAVVDPSDPGDVGSVAVVRSGSSDAIWSVEDWRPLVDSDSNAAITSLSAQVTIPADGTWDIEVKLVGRYDSNSNTTPHKTLVNLWEKVGAAATVKVDSAGNSISAQFGQALPMDATVHHNLYGATASTVYIYTATEDNLDVLAAAAPRDVQKIFVRATRRL